MIKDEDIDAIATSDEDLDVVCEKLIAPPTRTAASTTSRSSPCASRKPSSRRQHSVRPRMTMRRGDRSGAQRFRFSDSRARVAVPDVARAGQHRLVTTTGLERALAPDLERPGRHEHAALAVTMYVPG
jgi:hypothetical protein